MSLVLGYMIGISLAARMMGEDFILTEVTLVLCVHLVDLGPLLLK